MKTLTVIFFLALIGRIAFAQDTAFISQDKTTALFFRSPVRVKSAQSGSYRLRMLGNGVLTLKALTPMPETQFLWVQEVDSKKEYRIPVVFSYGRAGRRIAYGSLSSTVAANIRPISAAEAVASQLAAGKRTDVATHAKTNGIKAWIDRISLAGNQIFFRLDVRNRSNLPYDIDFVRFYIRDRKTVNRMATHEQEIIPKYPAMQQHNMVVKGLDATQVFAFKRFSLSDDEVLYVEVYERKGNRHLYLKIKPGRLDRLKLIQVPKPSALAMAGNLNHLFVNH